MTVATLGLLNHHHKSQSRSNNDDAHHNNKISKPVAHHCKYSQADPLSPSRTPSASTRLLRDAVMEPEPNTSSSPQLSRSTSRSSSKSRPSLSLDLSNLPALLQPTPPSNTLIITELHNLMLFQPASLAAIREAICAIAQLNSFSPLPSFRRIVCSFLTTDDAVRVRQHLEQQHTPAVFDGSPARIYFGEHTPIEGSEEAKRKKLLEAPHSQKLFFISPPPSPPHGWVMRNEDPPNKEVHASDLAEALARLGTPSQNSTSNKDPVSPVSASSDSEVARTASWPAASGSAGAGRSRSSTLIYHPSEHGGSPNLPAVMVEDTSIVDQDDEDMMDMDLNVGPGRKLLAHTARPPVELMQ